MIIQTVRRCLTLHAHARQPRMRSWMTPCCRTPGLLHADSNEAWVACNFPTDVGLFGKSISHDDRLYLTSHVPCQPTEKDLPTKKFPKKVQGDRSRSFQESWYDKKLESGEKIRRKWLIYSFGCNVLSGMFFVFATVFHFFRTIPVLSGMV